MYWQSDFISSLEYKADVYSFEAAFYESIDTPFCQALKDTVGFKRQHNTSWMKTGTVNSQQVPAIFCTAKFMATTE